MKKELIVKSNQIIEGKYNMSLTEIKIIAKLTSLIKKDDEDFKEFKFKISDILEELELGKENYTALKESVDKLITRKIEIKLKKVDEKNRKDILVTTFLSSCLYSYSTGEIILSFDAKLKPYFLQLKENFTKYYLENILSLKSFYAIRIYELLKQYEKIGVRQLEIEEIKRILDIQEEKSYKRYDNFKRKILEIAKREINEKTDLMVNFLEIKTSRKVTAINFTIKAKKIIEEINVKENIDFFINSTQQTISKSINSSSPDLDQLIELLPEEEPIELWTPLIKKALQKYEFELIRDDLIHCIKKKPKNLYGYFGKSLENPEGLFSKYDTLKNKKAAEDKKQVEKELLKEKEAEKKREIALKNKIEERYSNLSKEEIQTYEKRYNKLSDIVKRNSTKEQYFKAFIKEDLTGI